MNKYTYRELHLSGPLITVSPHIQNQVFDEQYINICCVSRDFIHGPQIFQEKPVPETRKQCSADGLL
jgi:hypothetical protein